MQKLAGENSLKAYRADIEAQLVGKVAANHFHSEINGITVLLSDTAPTEDDENVLTLVVDASVLPTVTESTVETLQKCAYLLLSESWQVSLTFHVFIDGVEASNALYQLGYAYSYSSEFNVKRDWSSDNTFEGLLNFNTVRVRIAGMQKAFPVDFNAQKYPRVQGDDSGFYLDGTKVSAINYEQTPVFRWYFRDGVSSSSYESLSLHQITGVNQSVKVDTLDDFEEALYLTDESIGASTETADYLEFAITKDFTEDDKSFEAFAKGVGTDGIDYLLYDNLRIKEPPLSSSFAGHFTRYAINESYGTDNDNVTKKGTDQYVHFFFEIDREFTYDIQITLADNAGTILTGSSKVPFNSRYGSIVSKGCVVTIPAGSTSASASGYHQINTAGTYYIIASAEGVGTDFEQQLLIELTVTD